ncbi:hypothetical protein RRG08_022734 [Elysia crispata]|uniref:Uncharacterized protein n=1 Tax=Elysia crispata TaxID=231223 RepID=A0AAE1DF80_9GAST|nr:hypothetical protein RRG08_022734 [Elysia crispata]
MEKLGVIPKDEEPTDWVNTIIVVNEPNEFPEQEIQAFVDSVVKTLLATLQKITEIKHRQESDETLQKLIAQIKHGHSQSDKFLKRYGHTGQSEKTSLNVTGSY